MESSTTEINESTVDYSIAKPGVHMESVEENSLAHSDAFYALSALSDAGLERFVQGEKRLGKVRFLRKVTDKAVTGFIYGRYSRAEKSVEISYGVSSSDWGHAVERGLVRAASAAKRREDFLKRTFLHELGHHLLNVGGKDAWALVYKAFDAANPVTMYGGQLNEYFSECLVLYVYHPDELKALDGVGYNLVEQVFVTLGARGA